MYCGHTKMSDISEATRWGKLAMNVFNERFSSDTHQIPNLYGAYYGLIGIYTEKLSSCVDNLQKGKLFI